jgi:hypothetical protein
MTLSSIIKKAQVALTVAAIAASIYLTGSMNPLAAYRSGSIVAQVLVTILLWEAAFVAVRLGFARRLVASARRAAGGEGASVGDARCYECSLYLVRYVGSHGKPVRCRGCERAFHGLCLADGGDARRRLCRRCLSREVEA